MKLSSRCFPVGALPYENITTVTRMVAKLFEQNPYLALLPNIEEDDNIIKHSFEGIPGVKYKDKKIILKTGTNTYRQGLLKLDKAFNSLDKTLLENYAIHSPFLEKYLQIIKKFKSKNAYINLLGPFTMSQMLIQSANELMLADKSFRKMFIQAICVKAFWAIEKIKEVSPDTVPVIILNEPLFCRFGVIKRENEDIPVEQVTKMFANVIERIKAKGAIVAIQSMEKCDWKIPINAGVDIISFDAYNNPNNLCIIPDTITDFVSRGGKINWAIVPVMTEAMVKGLNIDYVANRLFSTMEGLILAGVPEKFVYNSALVSIQGDVENLPVIFAEKSIILANQLSKRIPIKN